jgi:hypothetical protein
MSALSLTSTSGTRLCDAVCSRRTDPRFGDAGFRRFLFTPIFRYNSPRPFNILTGELNNDRHNTTDRPYFAGRNIGMGPSFWL